jgi:UPF0716 family protein affecting phage T7 exclusion
MTRLINQYSFLIFAIPVILLLLYFLLRPPGSLLKQILALLLLSAVVGFFLLARPGGSALSGAQAEALLLDAGRPSLVEVYSDY